MEYRTLAQVLSLATRARQVLLGLLSRQGASSSPHLLGGYHCTYISISRHLQLFSAAFSFSLGLATIPEWLFAPPIFPGLSLRRGRVCGRKKEKGRVRVRAPPVCISRVQFGGRLAGSAHSNPPHALGLCPSGNRKGRRKDHSGVLQVRALLFLFALPSTFLAVFVRSDPRVTLLQGKYGG